MAKKHLFWKDRSVDKYAIDFFFSTKMSTQRNRLNEIVLLSTKTMCYLEWMDKKTIPLNAQKVCLPEPMGR